MSNDRLACLDLWLGKPPGALSARREAGDALPGCSRDSDYGEGDKRNVRLKKNPTAKSRERRQICVILLNADLIRTPFSFHFASPMSTKAAQ
jgi:hypothetical protein